MNKKQQKAPIRRQAKDIVSTAAPPLRLIENLWEPTVDNALNYGGIGYRDVESPYGRVLVLIDSQLEFRTGDTLVLYWGDKANPASTHTIDEQFDQKNPISMWVAASHIVEVGDGQVDVWYTFRNKVFGETQESYKTNVLVQTTKPGGDDPDVIYTPYVNENLRPPSVQPSFIDPPAIDRGVRITVPAWENMAVSDVLRINWGSQIIARQPLKQTEIGNSVVVDVDRLTIANAGDNDRLMISYSITNAVSTWSKNAPPTSVAVQIGGAIFAAPLVLEAPNGILNHDALMGNDATVSIPYQASIAANDTIHLVFDGQSMSLLPGHEESDVRQGDPMKISNGVLAWVSPGSAALYYVVKDANGTTKGQSLRTPLEITGNAFVPAAPLVTEARDKTLDPADALGGAHVIVPAWPGMRLGDTMKFYWSGIDAGGDQVVYPYLATIGQDSPLNLPVAITVPFGFVGGLAGGNVDVYYLLQRENSTLSSRHLLLNITANNSLPKPDVEGVVDGVLYAGLVPNGANLTIPAWPNMDQGDRVDWYWAAPTVEGSTQGYRIVDAGAKGHDIRILIPRNVIEADAAKTDFVTVYYKVTPKATGSVSQNSERNEFNVVQSPQITKLLVVGARSSVGSASNRGSSRYLRALDATTRTDVDAEWCYADDTKWVPGVSFRDTRPWIPLKVRFGLNTVVINPVNVCGSGNNSDTGAEAALSALSSDGRVTAWGAPAAGGNVPPALATKPTVVSIGSTSLAFATIHANGTVSAWGDPSMGGAAPNVLISDACRVVGNDGAFVVLRGQGYLSGWGEAYYGGNIPPDILDLHNIVTVVPGGAAFCALTNNGEIVSWGSRRGDVGEVSQYRDIVDVQGNGGSFVALRSNGKVVAWGLEAYGGSVPANIKDRNDIVELASATPQAHAVITVQRSVLAWGIEQYGGAVPFEISRLTDIEEVTASFGAFCARRRGGTVVAWGNPDFGGAIPVSFAELNHDIVQVAATSTAFAALRRDGSVVAWGNAEAGGDTTKVANQLKDIRAIYSDTQAFVAIKNGGGVVTWGGAGNGGDSSGVKSYLDGHLFYEAADTGSPLAARLKRRVFA
ncbi:hypothetical protein LAV78_20205 [Brucella intermedia]|uniref:RCC1 domain-containing protein n=1 Tax=Brucella intermedia TaxID=94625 RepID=UPI001E28A385|nr:hypothetical protein [Brucella intermedia]MCB4920845.1 hypothetical protein [Brucella intermedia]